MQTATADGADYRNRIFTVRAEIPFAGHPSLGTAVAVAEARREAASHTCSRPAQASSRSTCAATATPGPRRCSRSPRPSGPRSTRTCDGRGRPAPGGCTPRAPAAGGLDRTPDADRPRARRRCDREGTPDFALVDLCSPGAAPDLYLAWHDGAGAPGAHVHPLLLRGEDPATGSAAGPLCAYLQRAASARASRSRRASRSAGRAAAGGDGGRPPARQRRRGAGDRGEVSL